MGFTPGDPRVLGTVPPPPCPGGADQLPTPTPPSHRGFGDPCGLAAGGSPLPGAVCPAGSAGTRGLAGGAAGGDPAGGDAAGAGRGAGALPGAALGRAVHPRAPAQVRTPPPSLPPAPAPAGDGVFSAGGLWPLPAPPGSPAVSGCPAVAAPGTPSWEHHRVIRLQNAFFLASCLFFLNLTFL